MQAPGIGRALTELLQPALIRQLILVILPLKEYWITSKTRTLRIINLSSTKSLIFFYLGEQVFDIEIFFDFHRVF